MIESAGMGGTYVASDLLVQTVGDFVPIPSPKRQLGIQLWPSLLIQARVGEFPASRINYRGDHCGKAR